MQTKTLIIAMLSALLAVPAANVQAAREASYTDRARVIKVQPIYKQSTQRDVYCTPGRAERQDYRRGNSYTSEVVGAIVGGAVGNQFGKGRGRDAMTVAGAALGATVAHDLDRRDQRRFQAADRRDQRRFQTADRRCKVVEHANGSQELLGYRVKYRYDGQTFWTRTRRHPGDWVPVEVTIDPKPGRKGRF